MREFFSLLEELRSIAQMGLNYSRDHYDRERYERLLQLVSEQYAQISGLPTVEISNRFRAELGYITPKLGVAGALWNEEGKLLLVRRTDDQCWCLPCGWAEVGETPQESLAREVREETGLEVRVGSLIRIGGRKPGDFGLPHSSVHLQFHCELLGGTLCDSLETYEVGFYAEDTPRQWHLDHDVETQAAWAFYKQLSQ